MVSFTLQSHESTAQDPFIIRSVHYTSSLPN